MGCGKFVEYFATRRFTDKLADSLKLDYCTSNHLEKNNSTSLLENQLENPNSEVSLSRIEESEIYNYQQIP